MSNIDDFEGFPIFDDLGMPASNERLEHRTMPQSRTRRILGAIPTYLATVGEAVREGKIAPTPDGLIITPELFREPSD